MYIAFFLLEVILLLFLSRKLINKLMAFLYKIFRKERYVEIIFALLFLPGTFIHEASHFLAALFLLVPVGNIELMPKREGKGLKLGSVPIGKTDPLRRMIIGSAPLLFGITIIFLLIYWITSHNILTNNLLLTTLTAYLVFQISNTMFLSKKDTEGFWIVGVIFIILFLVYQFLGVSIDFSLSSERRELVDILFRNASLFLLVPIVIDTAVLSLINLVNR